MHPRMQRTDIAIVYTPVGGGHRAAAFAVAEAARARGLRVELVDAFEHALPIFGRSYVAAHLTGQRALPTFYGAAYHAANHRDGALDPLRRGFDHVAYAGLVKRVFDLSPRVVVATHHLPLVVLGRARRSALRAQAFGTRALEAPLVGVVTDYTAHACWAEPGVDAFCAPCERAEIELVEHGVPRERIVRTGIPVRPVFEAIARVRQPARHEPLRVLVTMGGFGAGPVRRIVRSFAYLPFIELTVVCGNAPALVRRVEREAARWGVRARVLGFERDMASRVAAAHVVVGKAGGLTVSETMTAGRPMIVVGAVPGNEKLNEQMIVDAGAGYAATPAHVGRLATWMRRAETIEAMGQRARALVAPHAAERVVDAAAALAWRSETSRDAA
jgi:processive 1,2-diacylglycerol beta-glucosyltransferase